MNIFRNSLIASAIGLSKAEGRDEDARADAGVFVGGLNNPSLHDRVNRGDGCDVRRRQLFGVHEAAIRP